MVLAIGETAELSGESSSRTNIEIPQAQKDLLIELKKDRKTNCDGAFYRSSIGVK